MTEYVDIRIKSVVTLTYRIKKDKLQRVDCEPLSSDTATAVAEIIEVEKRSMGDLGGFLGYVDHFASEDIDVSEVEFDVQITEE